MLLVDDDEPIRKVLTQGMELAGLRVVAVPEGRKAKALLGKQAFGWMVTDIVMPDCDGFELVQFARHRQPAMQIIAISGGGRGRAADYLKVAQLLGVSHILQKPFSYTDLVGLINSSTADKGRKTAV